MAIICHPPQGTILICDFYGFHEPEMVKERPVIVISKPILSRKGLCTIVATSTTDPPVELPMHYKIKITPRLPEPFDAEYRWIKGDMVYAFAFDRFNFPYIKKNRNGKRIYDIRQVTPDQLLKIQECVMAGIGIMKMKKEP